MDESQELSPESKALIAEREKMLGSDFHEQPTVSAPITPIPLQPQNKRPTVGDFGSKVIGAVKNMDTNPIVKWLNDPAHAAALTGVPVGLWRSGANLNPIDPRFLKYNPRPTEPAPRAAEAAVPAEKPQTPVYETSTGQASKAGRTAAENMFTNQSANKSWALAPEGKIESLKSHGIEGPSMANIYGEMGPTEVRMIGGVPMEIPLNSANVAATPVTNTTESVANAVKTALPGVSNAENWLRSVLPTLRTVGKTAGVLGGAADTAARAYQGDASGAGISGIGTGLAAMTPFPVDVAAGGLSMLANYYRDNPKLYEEHRRELESSNPEDVYKLPQ